MSLPSSAFEPVSGVDWPMTIVLAVTPGTWACAAKADRARTRKARRSMDLIVALTSVKAGERRPLGQSPYPKLQAESTHGPVGHRNRAGGEDAAHRRRGEGKARHQRRASRAVR